MASGCKAAIGCVDARVPVRASYVSLYKWPESDAEFVRSLAMARRRGEPTPPPPPDQSPAVYYNGGGMRHRVGVFDAGEGGHYYSSCSPRVVDSYSCRQIYLRSYTFSKKKESVPERTMACLGRVRNAVVFPLFPRAVGGGSDAGSVTSASSIVAGDVAGAGDGNGGKGNRRRRRRRRRRCAVVRRLQALFHRLLACTTSVDVADAAAGGSEPPSR
uniref:Uncharacterized protein n=1 Tax=Leersia perrieri TaxID=77586 RepID=A0A0D9WC56_9ORYZ